MSDASRSKEVLDLCDQVLLIEPEKRAAFLVELCGEDHELKTSVELLLQAIEDSGSFLIVDEPAQNG
jgi:hypothetical protein